jgi:hypothetical protein
LIKKEKEPEPPKVEPPQPEEPKKIKEFVPRYMPNPFQEAEKTYKEYLHQKLKAKQKYSDISKNRYKQDEWTKIKFCIRPGNNSQLITKVFEYSGRTNPVVDSNDHETFLFPGWELQEDIFDDFFNFKWKPTSHGINYKSLGNYGVK